MRTISTDPRGMGGSTGGALGELASGLWRWERRHPEWHPGRFGATVASYLVHVDDVTLMIDPLVDGDDDPVLADLDRLALGRVRVLITIPYHTRSAELIWRRYRDRDAQIVGHSLVAKRLGDTSGFRIPSDEEYVAGVARFHRIGRPLRAEMPIEIPSQRTLVFGDAVVEHAGALRLWESPVDGDSRRKWYDERFLPSMRSLAALDTERILVTHGQAVMQKGRQALAKALDRGPWQPPRARAS